MDVFTIIENYLEKNGFDGLFNIEDEFCSCEIGTIAGECGSVWPNCCAGHKTPVDDGFQWIDGPRPDFREANITTHKKLVQFKDY